MAVVRFRGSNAFRTKRRVEKNSPPVRMQITQCDPRDRNQNECIWLAVRCCHIAFRATDVVRGRLNPRVLDAFVSSPIIDQVLNLYRLLKGEEERGITEHPYAKNLPIRILGLHGMVLHPNCFDACVSLVIGTQPHTVNVVLRIIGSRWICTYLQMG